MIRWIGGDVGNVGTGYLIAHRRELQLESRDNGHGQRTGQSSSTPFRNDETMQCFLC